MRQNQRHILTSTRSILFNYFFFNKIAKKMLSKILSLYKISTQTKIIERKHYLHTHEDFIAKYLLKLVLVCITINISSLPLATYWTRVF